MTTGRAFFDEIENPRDRIIAHMRRDPFEDAERLRAYPAAIAKLLRAATAREPRRPPVADRVRQGVRGGAVALLCQAHLDEADELCGEAHTKPGETGAGPPAFGASRRAVQKAQPNEAPRGGSGQKRAERRSRRTHVAGGRTTKSTRFAGLTQ